MSKNSAQNTHSTDQLENSFNKIINQVFLYKKDIAQFIQDNNWKPTIKEFQFSLQKTQNNITSIITLTEENESRYIFEEKINSDRYGINRNINLSFSQLYPAVIRFKSILFRNEAYLTGEIYEMVSRRKVPVPPENYHISLNN
ncbi:MAG: hypothetical protein ABH828_01220 [archaeon]